MDQRFKDLRDEIERQLLAAEVEALADDDEDDDRDEDSG